LVIERMTARKAEIRDLMSGSWVKKEGMEPSYIVSPSGEKLSRVRLMGTVVGRFVAEDGNFASITLDDGTDTMRVKTFKTAKPLDTVNPGSLVEVIGKVREYNAEIYVIPEVVTAITDPNLLILRQAELAAKAKGLKENPLKAEEPVQETADENALRKQILDVIAGNPEGVEYSAIPESVSAPEAQIESVVNDLLAEGICYEPTPGKIKKI
jgi:RPA family protein